MQQPFTAINHVDDFGNPTGGSVMGTGLTVFWQDGPIGRDAAKTIPNGAFVEDLLAAAKQRLEFYESAGDGKFACQENRDMLDHINEALAAAEARTARREAAGVEGTHEQHEGADGVTA